MLEMLRQLYAYDAWADAEHWRAISAFPAALEDKEIHDRLDHIHLVQRAYLSLLRGEHIDWTKPQEPFPTIDAMKASVRQYHQDAAAWLATIEAGDLGRLIGIEWFKGSQPKMAEAMMQVSMHGQSHRGQNATRLRQLGGKMPITDFVMWVIKKYPAAQWEQ